MQTREKIKQMRRKLGVSAQTLADLIGVSRATLYRYESGDIEKIPLQILEKIADALDCSPLSLMENPIEEQVSAPYVTLPVVGRIPLDGVVIPEECIEGYERAEPEFAGETSFYFRITGDCMYPIFLEGDLALIQRQPYAENGSYAAVSVDGGDAYIRKISCGANYLELHCVNPMYPVRRYEGPEMARVQICGVVKEIKRKF